MSSTERETVSSGAVQSDILRDVLFLERTCLTDPVHPALHACISSLHMCLAEGQKAAGLTGVFVPPACIQPC